MSNEEEIKLVEEYRKGIHVNQLMKKYGFSTKKSITDKVKKHFPNTYKEIIEEAKINRKDYKINVKEINDCFVAYFIGLMLTDGYIQDNNKFGIQLVDEDCINFISKVTNKSYHTYNDNNPQHQECYRIIFSDNEQVNNLKRYGIERNKTKTISGFDFNRSEEKYIPYVIRGIIDGDGCIYYTSKHTPAFFIITASYNFAKWMQEILENKLYMNDIHITKTCDGYYRVETSLLTNLLKLRFIVYDQPYGMNRKYELLRKMFRDYNGNLL